jgi:hypothetical protein
MGSLAFVAASRAAFAVARDADDATGSRRLLIPIKNNIGNDRSGMAFTLSEHGTQGFPRVEWCDTPVSVSADDVIGSLPHPSPRQPTQLDDAADWLHDFLSNGPVAAQDVLRNAKQAGFSKRTLDRAKAELKAKSVKPAYEGQWVWALPGQSHAIVKHAIECDVVAIFDSLGNLGKTQAKNACCVDTRFGNLGHGCQPDVAGVIAKMPGSVGPSRPDALYGAHVDPSVAKVSYRTAEGA